MKRAEVANAKNLRNRMIKSSVKTALKRFDAALANGGKQAAEPLFNKTVGIVDKAVVKGVFHRNTANRKKAQLSVKLAKAE